jgi:UMF1 family MFS transporter
VRATALLVAVWFAVFSLPLFLFTPDAGSSGLAPGEAVRRGLATLAATFRGIGEHRLIVRFLIARMIYTDGLNTLFAFGGIYAAGTFGMGLDEVILFGIALNASAGLGAFLFAWVDDWIGPKRTILISLGALTVLAAAVLAAQTKTQFWVSGVMLGVFVGPAQAASRSLMARLAPPHLRAEMFGLYAFSGKATAFVGPAVLAWVTAYWGSQRAGMATILVFFAAGMALLWPLPEARR